MKNQLEYLKCFQCPACLVGELTKLEGGISCGQCHKNFPITNDIAWLFKEPERTQRDWENRYHLFIDMNKLEAERLKIEQQKPELLEKTKDRLRRLIQGKVEHGREVAKVLEPLKVSADNDPNAANLAGGTELPDTQGLMSYYVNICRDWNYGEEENAVCLREISQVLGENINLGIMGVIGSGASRLAYDIHRKFQVDMTLNTDINPFLFLTAQKIISGKGVHLYEFPIAPVGLEAFAVKLKCKAPEAIKQGFHFTLADGMNPIFKENCLDTLLTPWLIDIVHQDLKDQFRRYNRCLKIGGRWVNFGSLSFFHSDQTICYSVEEALEIVERCGFKIDSFRHEEIPYLHSPYSCQKRFERVLTFSATKIKDIEAPATPFNFVPEWLKNWDLPVPSTNMNIQQGMIHQALSAVFDLVDGSRSINAMAKDANFLQLPPENAAAVINNILSKFYNEKLKGRQF